MPLQRERKTPHIGEGHLREIGVKAGSRIFAGALVMSEGGLAAPGRAAPGLIALGRAEQSADNRGGADHALRVRIRRGVFGFRSLPEDPVLPADLGRECFVVDDETVARSSAANTRSPAGKVFALEGDLVFVDVA